MKTKIAQGLLALAAFAGATFGATQEAAAVQPIPQGTFKVAAERMAGLGVTFGQGDAYFHTGLLFGGNPGWLQFPRAGFDYFIIDGLSLGGSAGLSYSGAGDQFFGGILPRVGYAFSLSQSIDFWPRGGIGFVGWDGGGGPIGFGYTTAVLFLEGMFIWNIVPNVGLEFGPTIDVGLEPGITSLSGNAGLVVSF